MEGLFSEILYQMEKQEATVLVTITASSGSTPRGTGSQMLVGRKGRLWGTIGGGAVEGKSIQRAMELLTEQKSELREYPLHVSPTGDIGMVCGGDVTVWLQYIPADGQTWRALCLAALDYIHENRPAWFIQSVAGGEPALVSGAGETLAGSWHGSVPAGTEQPVFRQPDFLLPLGAAHRALLFGGGHVSRALVPVLQSVGFRVTVFDCREEFTSPSDFPGAQVICGDFARIFDYLTIGPRDFVAVMTSGHGHDFEVELQVLRRGAFAYLGVIGSSKKTASVNARLRECGIREEEIARVHTPIGTKIRAVTPAEIAVSIAGEMICVRAQLREGSPEGLHHRCPV